MVYSAYLSLYQWDGISPTKVFVGLGNYVTLFTQNDVFWIALRNNQNPFPMNGEGDRARSPELLQIYA